MPNFDILKLEQKEVLTELKWNGLVGELKILDQYTHRVNITDDGKLGIGTSTPTTGLHVSGKGVNGVMQVEREGKKLVINPNLDGSNKLASISTAKDSNMGLQLSVNANPALTIDVQGNVGIGGNLSVGGGILIEETKYPADQRKLALIPTDIDGDSKGFKYSWRKDNGQPRIDALQFDTDGNVYLNNNVGIGTTAPQAKLHVEGGVKISGNLYVDGKVGSMNIDRIEIGPWSIFQIGGGTVASYLYIERQTTGKINTLLRIDASGNIEISGKLVQGVSFPIKQILTN